MKKLTNLTDYCVKFATGIAALSVFSLIFIQSISASSLYDLHSVSYQNTQTTVLAKHPDFYRINFRYREETGESQRLFTQDELLSVRSFSDLELNNSAYLGQYDATIYYPISNMMNDDLIGWHGLSIDLGLNFKFIEQSYELSPLDHDQYRTHYGAYPMFSAAALYNFSFVGVSASFEGSYLNYKERELSEYRAKLTYKIANIFGVSGGWQQQQYQLDTTNQLRYDKQGPFVDLFYRF